VDSNELAAKGYSVSELPDSLYQDLSDLIHANDSLLRADFDMFFHDQDSFFETEPGVTVLNPYQAWIGEDVTLKPGVVVDASDGPVVIDEGAVVMPNAVITGPVYIGKNSTIKVGAKIYPGTTIGPVCKIGGEVEGSIFQAYSNKQHDGFLGHSFVGEWVNIGADTNNSDLKNTYMEVEFYSYRARQKIPSGSIFLGTLIGDHTKLGINTTINTGTVIGCGCNLWGSALITGFIPDLSWGTADALKPYRLPAFFATASVVKQRRKLVLSPAEIKLYQQIKELTDNV
jgi:UDP-N-acetylglucosamine diphosphorylase/glucosamine-1-phosphate N-acetyltransferase